MGDSQIAVSSVAFGDGILNIQYMEIHEQNDDVMIARSMSIDMDNITDEVDTLADLLEAIVDRGLLLLRKPPDSIPSRKHPADVTPEE